MGALTTSDYASISDGAKIYLYYQNDSSQLREIVSSDGSNWTENATAVADGLNPGGSPITAYYVAHDGTAGGKTAIHVVYLDASGQLHEKVKSPIDSTAWEDRDLPDDIKKAPIPTSRLSSGICHDNSPGAHQWVFFERLNQDTGSPEIAELRSGSESQFKWRYQKILSEKADTALPGTQIATNLTNPTTHLFFQDHDGNVSEFLGGYDSWNSQKTIIAKENVQINSPLTATSSSVADKPYVFYVTKSTPFKIMSYNDGKSSEIAPYVPGTKLGAAVLGEKVYLFHKPLEHPTSVWVRVYDGSSWKLSSKVVD